MIVSSEQVRIPDNYEENVFSFKYIVELKTIISKTKNIQYLLRIKIWHWLWLIIEKTFTHNNGRWIRISDLANTYNIPVFCCWIVHKVLCLRCPWRGDHTQCWILERAPFKHKDFDALYLSWMSTGRNRLWRNLTSLHSVCHYKRQIIVNHLELYVTTL